MLRYLSGLLVALVLAPLTAHAEARTASEIAGAAALQRMADFMAGLERFSVSIDSHYDVLQETGEKIEFAEKRSLTVLRPNHFRLATHSADGERYTATFDGTDITLYNAQANYYAKAPLRGDIDAALIHAVRDLQLRIPLAMLFLKRLPEALASRVVSVELVEKNHDGLLHLSARGQTVDMQIWLPASGDPLPQRVVLTYKDAEGQPQFRGNFTGWNLAPEVTDEQFDLLIPQDATRIDLLAERKVLESDAGTGEQPGAICYSLQLAPSAICRERWRLLVHCCWSPLPFMKRMHGRLAVGVVVVSAAPAQPPVVGFLRAALASGITLHAPAHARKALASVSKSGKALASKTHARSRIGMNAGRKGKSSGRIIAMRYAKTGRTTIITMMTGMTTTVTRSCSAVSIRSTT